MWKYGETEILNWCCGTWITYLLFSVPITFYCVMFHSSKKVENVDHGFLLMTNLTHFFMYLFISSLYMFRALQCSSSGDQIILIHHLVWLVSVTARYAGQDRHIKQSLTQTNHTRWCINTFAASYLNTQGLNNLCLKSPASTLVDLTFQSRALRSFSLNQLRNLSL